MKNLLTKAALTLALALSVCVPAASAKTKKPKHSAEHVAAVKKCEETFKTALKEAKTMNGKARKAAEAQAKKAEKQCMADAPM